MVKKYIQCIEIHSQVATRFGCKVMGANISPQQNKMNLEEAEKLGVDLSDVTREKYGIKQWQEVCKRMDAARKLAGKA